MPEAGIQDAWFLVTRCGVEGGRMEESWDHLIWWIHILRLQRCGGIEIAGQVHVVRHRFAAAGPRAVIIGVGV